VIQPTDDAPPSHTLAALAHSTADHLSFGERREHRPGQAVELTGDMIVGDHPLPARDAARPGHQ